MAHGKTLPPEVHWIVVHLSTIMTKEDISVYTGVAIRSVERILQCYQVNGTVKLDDHQKKRPGNGRGALSDDDVVGRITMMEERT